MTSPRINKWLIAAIIMLPTFLHVMDISVVNVSLPHIQGSLNAGVDEVTWVITSYLVTNAIIIPIAPWLARIFGRKRYLLTSVALFTASSLACGASTSLTMLICFRVLQGLAGGGLAPLGQAILLETFPQKEHGMANAIFGMGVTVAPVLGPVFGGWITDQWNWPWVFYINLPAGLLAFFLIKGFISDPSYSQSTQRYIDTWGILFLSVGLGCLQVVLDKGEREDWFSSRFIISLAVIAAASLIIFFWVERKTPHPVVDLKPFRDRSFSVANVINFLGYFTLLGSIVLLPLYLQKLMGYTALWAGLVLGPGGFTSLIVMPIAGLLMIKGINPKWLLGIGLAVQAASLWMMAAFNLEADFMYVAWPRVVLGLALGFFSPLWQQQPSPISPGKKSAMPRESSIFCVISEEVSVSPFVQRCTPNAPSYTRLFSAKTSPQRIRCIKITIRRSSNGSRFTNLPWPTRKAFYTSSTRRS